MYDIRFKVYDEDGAELQVEELDIDQFKEEVMNFLEYQL